MSQKGWAVINAAGEVDIRTVSPTRRAAIVNWLFLVAEVFISTQHTDDKIHQIWVERRGEFDVVRVVVRVLEG